MLIFVIVFACVTTSGQKTAAKSKKIIVSGDVTDSIGNPIKGASIIIDNINTNIVTNDKGSYKVRVKPDAKKISVTTLYNGVAEDSLMGRRSINFRMKGIIPQQNLKQHAGNDDESVNIGYGSNKKENIATPVNKLDTKSIKNVHFNDIYDMIAGTIPGVQVSGNSIQIRGASSINLSNEPLFVVDGIIVDSIDNIDPNEVESIEVLKGASATIYGSQAAAGVILIQRKGPEKKRK